MTNIGMIRLLRDLVEIESPTYSPGTRRVAELLSTELRALGGKVTLLGDESHVRGDFGGVGAPILVLGHMDTVWPEGTLERLPFRVEGGRAYGPGVFDMKAGLVMIVAALRQATPRRPVRVLLTADEEMGTRTGRAYVAEAARDAVAAFVVEPCLPDGGAKVARKGLGRFRLVIDGRAGHAGDSPGTGGSAIEELAHQIIRLHGITDLARGISVNVGVVHGGTRENVIAERAEAGLDIRVIHTSDMVRVEAALADLQPVLRGTRLSVSGEWTRPPLEPTDASATLFATARRYGQDLGLELTEGGASGGSDGNLVGALGVPVLDGLGPAGGGAHSEGEHVLLETLPVRARLLARLLEEPGL